MLLAAGLLSAEATAQSPAGERPPASQMLRLMNQATIGLAAGQPEGAPLRFATELARFVDDGANLRVVPIVTRGPSENVNDLLYLRGIDAAIIYGDVLEQFSKQGQAANLARRINYITHLFPSELHVFVRPEIKSLEDLAGKPVNFNTPGTAAAYSGPIIFERLGIKVDARFDPHPVAMAEMANNNKYAATVWVSTKPLDPFLKRKWPDGFKFLPVALTEKLEQYYLPAQLDASDYPGLIPAGQSVQTIGVPAVLAVFAWKEGSDRHARVVRFIDRLIERLPKLQSTPGLHPRWADLNLAATVPGWQRFPAMQARIDAMRGTRAPTVTTAAAAAAAKSGAKAIAADAAPLLPGFSPKAASDAKQARQLLEQAGYIAIGELTLDARRIWLGVARKDDRPVRVAVDQQGRVYERRISGGP
jgi:TRAP-type uncharacterized transport system substrate-binding protein